MRSPLFWLLQIVFAARARAARRDERRRLIRLKVQPRTGRAFALMQLQRSFADFFTTPTKGCKLRVNEFNVFKNPQGKYAAYHVVTELDGVEYSVWVRWRSSLWPVADASADRSRMLMRSVFVVIIISICRSLFWLLRVFFDIIIFFMLFFVSVVLFFFWLHVFS